MRTSFNTLVLSFFSRKEAKPQRELFVERKFRVLLDRQVLLVYSFFSRKEAKPQRELFVE